MMPFTPVRNSVHYASKYVLLNNRTCGRTARWGSSACGGSQVGAALTPRHALAPGRALAPGPPLRLYPSSRPSRPELLYRGQIHADEQRNGRPQPQHAPSMASLSISLLVKYLSPTHQEPDYAKDFRGRKRRRAPALLTQTFRSAKREDHSHHLPLRPKTSGAVNAGIPRRIPKRTFRRPKAEDRSRGTAGGFRWEFTSGLSTCRRPERQPWQPQWHPQAGCSWARR